jgi:hypothetical protein
MVSQVKRLPETRVSNWVGIDSLLYNSDALNLVIDNMPRGRQAYLDTSEVNSFFYGPTRNVYDPEQLMSTAFRTMRPCRPYSCLPILNLP